MYYQKQPTISISLYLIYQRATSIQFRSTPRVPIKPLHNASADQGFKGNFKARRATLIVINAWFRATPSQSKSLWRGIARHDWKLSKIGWTAVDRHETYLEVGRWAKGLFGDPRWPYKALFASAADLSSGSPWRMNFADSPRSTSRIRPGSATLNPPAPLPPRVPDALVRSARALHNFVSLLAAITVSNVTRELFVACSFTD